MRALLLCLPLALLTVHCSLAVDYDGFVGTGEPPLDSSAAVLDSATVDTAVATDSATAMETATDAALEADAGDPDPPPVFVDAGTFCSETSATFCDDFDRKDLPGTWIREGVHVRLTSNGAKSKPNDLLVNVPPAATGGTFVSKITRAFGAPVKGIDLAFALNPEKLSEGTAFLLVGAIEFLRGESKYSLRLVYLNGQLRLEESNLVPPPGNKDFYHPFFALPLSKWSRVRLEIGALDGSATAQIFVDDVPVMSKSPLTVPTAIDFTPTVILGAVFGGMPHTGWVLRYDDVTVTLR